MFEKILVAVDGSEHADRALETACDLAKRYDDAALTIVHVPAMPYTGVGLGAGSLAMMPDMDALMADANALLDKAKTQAAALGCGKVTAKLLKGEPAEAILDEAVESDAKLIVVGRRGFGRLTGMLLGSVSQKLTSHAACPVLTLG